MLPVSFTRLLVVCGLTVLSSHTTVGAQDEFQAEADLVAKVGKYLPRCLPKFQERARIRTVILGDSVSLFTTPTPDDRFNRQKVWHYHFLGKLTDHFYYSGGLVEAPSSQAPDYIPPPPPIHLLPEEPMELPPRGEILRLDVGIDGSPAIVYENFAKGGAVAMRSMQTLSTYGFDNSPDLVFWMYGVNDAMNGLPVESYKDALRQTIAACKQRKVDLIIAGPSMIFGEDLKTIAMTLPYAEAARTLAKEAGYLYVDMADALGRFTWKTVPTEATAFTDYIAALKNYYLHDDVLDVLHPNAKAHRVMGETAWRALMGESTPDPLNPQGYFTNASAKDPQPNLYIALHQPPAPSVDAPPSALDGIILTILEQPGGWVRTEGATFQIKPIVERRNLRMPVQPAPDRKAMNPVGESTTTGVILHEGNSSRLVSLTIPILPVALDLPVQRLEGVAGDLLLDCQVYNKQPKELKAKAHVEWLELKMDMDVAIPANSNKPLRLRLPLPEGNFAKGLLTVTLKSGEETYTCQRMVDASRHFLPGQRMPLAGPANAKFTPAVTVNADRLGLYTTYELPLASDNPLPTAVLLMIDARAAADRGKPGFVDRWQINIPAQDGPIPITRLRPAAFGNGYDREIDPNSIRATVRTEGAKRIAQIDIPKNDFYLHQWSVADTGQNVIGFNTKLLIPGVDPNMQDVYSLLNTSFHDTDTSSLGVLQLSPKATGEWSVRIY